MQWSIGGDACENTCGSVKAGGYSRGDEVLCCGAEVSLTTVISGRLPRVCCSNGTSIMTHTSARTEMIRCSTGTTNNTVRPCLGEEHIPAARVTSNQARGRRSGIVH